MFNDVLNILEPDPYCAKIDLKSAYRSCGIHESDTILTGLKWKCLNTGNVVYLKDMRLPFGCRKMSTILIELAKQLKS